MDAEKAIGQGTGDFGSSALDLGGHFHTNARGMDGYVALAAHNAENPRGALFGVFDDPKGPVYLGG
jgi:hypothetical protein